MNADRSTNGKYDPAKKGDKGDVTTNSGVTDCARRRGKDNYDFAGASISKTVKMNGKVQFHYDEALGDYGLASGYLPVSWDEI